MSDSEDKKPLCFGVLDKVFPKTEDGLRTSPESCMMACPHKTECLRSAINEGAGAGRVQEESVDRAYESGTISFLERWSRKKHFTQRAELKQKEKKSRANKEKK